MLCTKYPSEKTTVYDTSARMLRPTVFLCNHYDRLNAKIRAVLHRRGKKLTQLESYDILHDTYLCLAAQERKGIWAPLLVDLDTDKMTAYILGVAKVIITVKNSQQFDNKILKEKHAISEDMLESLEREELRRQRENLLEKINTTLFSYGIDVEASAEILEPFAEYMNTGTHTTIQWLMESLELTEDELKTLGSYLKQLNQIEDMEE